jgi:hypothetical protein
MRETTRFVEYGVSFVDGGNVRVTKGKAGRHEVWR